MIDEYEGLNYIEAYLKYESEHPSHKYVITTEDIEKLNKAPSLGESLAKLPENKDVKLTHMSKEETKKWLKEHIK